MSVTEDYCSFEVAKLLKEKGFDECTCGFYYDNSAKAFLISTPSYHNKSINVIAAPTHQMAMRWLRLEKSIAIIPIISSVLDNEKFLWNVEITVAETNETYNQGWVYEIYEQACEAAIKYCLTNLI